MTETKPSPVTRWRRKAAEHEAVRADGTPEVLAILTGWGADPAEQIVAGNRALRIWGARGYQGAFPGDWLVRDRHGATRYDPEAFAAAFEAVAGAAPSEPGGGGACDHAPLLAKAQECLAFERERADAAEKANAELRPVRDADTMRLVAAERERIRDLADRSGAVCTGREGTSFYFSALLSDPDPREPDVNDLIAEEAAQARDELDGRLRETLSAGVAAGPPDLNNGRPSVWSGACAPGGMVCAVPDPSALDGICGMPVETEPCNRHGESRDA